MAIINNQARALSSSSMHRAAGGLAPPTQLLESTHPSVQHAFTAPCCKSHTLRAVVQHAFTAARCKNHSTLRAALVMMYKLSVHSDAIACARQDADTIRNNACFRVETTPLPPPNAHYVTRGSCMRLCEEAR